MERIKVPAACINRGGKGFLFCSVSAECILVKDKAHNAANYLVVCAALAVVNCYHDSVASVYFNLVPACCCFGYVLALPVGNLYKLAEVYKFLVVSLILYYVL